jgi:hypothetical protein
MLISRLRLECISDTDRLLMLYLVLNDLCIGITNSVEIKSERIVPRFKCSINKWLCTYHSLEQSLIGTRDGKFQDIMCYSSDELNSE